jgi:hypothetical protein
VLFTAGLTSPRLHLVGHDRKAAARKSQRGPDRQIVIEKARAGENDKMITCVKLALTGQLICVSDQTLVCTDNGSLAQLIGVSACTGPDRSQPNDDRRRVPDQTRFSSSGAYWK